MGGKEKKDPTKINEPVAPAYKSREIRIFNSVEEQETYELQQMAALSPLEILQQLRSFINHAYSMHGYDPDKLPLIHKIQIVTE
jgi:hypothetical protein